MNIKKIKNLKNRKSSFYFVFILIFLTLFVNLYSGAFENLEPGARSTALSGNYICLGDDNEVILINPAGVYKTRDTVIEFSQGDLHGLGLININYLSIAKSGIGNGVVAVSWYRLNTKQNAAYLNYSENVYIFSFARKVLKKLTAGINLKYLFAEFSDIKGTGYTIDAGIIYNLPRKIDLGFVLTNLTSPDINWGTNNTDTLPLSVSAGISYEPNDSLSFEFDLKNPELKEFIPGLAGEIKLFKNYVVLRSGLDFRSQGIDYGIGVGIVIKKITFDFGLKKTYYLDPTQILDLKIRF